MITRIMTCTAVMALLAGGAWAQDTAPQPAMPEQTEEQAAAPATPIDPDAVVPEQEEQQWLASNYLGHSVYNRDDEEIGTVDDLVIEEDGGITALVVGVGGFLGLGMKKVGVDFAAVDVQQDDTGMPKLVIDGSREALEEAASFVDKQTREAERQAEQLRMEQQQQQQQQ